MTAIDILYPTSEDQKNIISDYLDMAKGLELSENLLQLMKKELHFEQPITYPNGKGDPMTDLKLLGNRPPNSLPTKIMDTPDTPDTPEAKVEVTKVEVEAPKVTEEFILKFCKTGKMLGLSDETIMKIKDELSKKLAPQESTTPAEEKPTPTPEPTKEKSNLLADLLK